MFTSSCGFYKVFGPTTPAMRRLGLKTTGQPLRRLVRPRALYRANDAGPPKSRQIPGWVFVDLAFQIKVQGPKLALAHIFLDSMQGEHSQL